MSFGQRGKVSIRWLSRFFCLITKLLKIYERAHKSSINIRLAAAEAFSYATNGGAFSSFTFTRVCGILFATSRKWSILPLRSARKMKKEMGGRIFEGF